MARKDTASHTDWTREPIVSATTLVRGRVASFSGLDLAAKTGALRPIGRRGGTGVRMYNTPAVLAWLSGSTPQVPAPTKAVAPRPRAPANTTPALERIAATARGSR